MSLTLREKKEAKVTTGSKELPVSTTRTLQDAGHALGRALASMAAEVAPISLEAICT